MTPADLTAARTVLGLTAAGLGRALELEGRDPGRQVLKWEAAQAAIPGPARVAVRFLLLEHARNAQDAQEPVSGADAPAAPPSPVLEASQPAHSRRRG